MKYKLRILKIIVILFFISCNNQNTEIKNLDNDLIKENLKGKVKSYTQATYNAEEKFGETQRYKRPKEDEYFKKEFNEMGNIISELHYYKNGEKRYKTIYEYNKDQNLIYKYDTIIGVYDKIKPIEKYKYDKNQNLLEKMKFNKGILWYRRLYEYDRKGNLVSDALIKKGKTSKKKVYTFENDRVIHYVAYDGDGEQKNKTEFKYDDNGNIIEKITNWKGGDVTKSFLDKNGNEIKYISYNSSGFIEMKREFKYDNDGNQIELLFYNEDGTISKQLFEYDENGNEIYYEDFTEGSRFKREEKYDKHGNLTWYKFSNLNSNFHNLYEKEYQYDEYFNWTIKKESNGKYSPEVVERSYEYYK